MSEEGKSVLIPERKFGHLKTRNAKDFEEWTRALEKASNTARGVAGEETSPETPRLKVRTSEAHIAFSSQEEREWEQVEALVSRIVGTRDAIRRLTRDTAPAPASTSNRQSYAGLGIPGVGSPSPDESSDLFATASDKKSFWRRKSSAPSSPHLFPRIISSQLANSAPTSVATTISAIGSPSSPSSRKARHQGDASMHDHCTDLLSDLDAVLLDFSTVLANSKRRRMQTPKSAVSRNSMDSTSTGEFYDAETMLDRSQSVMMIDRNSGEDTQTSEADDEFVTDASSISSGEEDNLAPLVNGAASLFPV